MRPSRALAAKQGKKIVGAKGPSEVVALHLGTAPAFQTLELFFGLDAFGNGHETQFRGKQMVALTIAALPGSYVILPTKTWAILIRSTGKRRR